VITFGLHVVKKRKKIKNLIEHKKKLPYQNSLKLSLLLVIPCLLAPKWENKKCSKTSFKKIENLDLKGIIIFLVIIYNLKYHYHSSSTF